MQSNMQLSSWRLRDQQWHIGTIKIQTHNLPISSPETKPLTASTAPFLFFKHHSTYDKTVHHNVWAYY